MGYRGPLQRQNFSRNIPITVGSESEMWDKLMKEVELGRHAGPFKQIPYKFFIQSPIGLVPKSGNKTRLIFHLSFDFDEVNKSFNHFTPDEFCSVKYCDLDFAIKTILSLLHREGERDCVKEKMRENESEGKEQFQQEIGEHVSRHIFTTVYMSKSDLMSAFRILPVFATAEKSPNYEMQVSWDGNHYVLCGEVPPLWKLYQLC